MGDFDWDDMRLHVLHSDLSLGHQVSLADSVKVSSLSLTIGTLGVPKVMALGRYLEPAILTLYSDLSRRPSLSPMHRLLPLQVCHIPSLKRVVKGLSWLLFSLSQMRNMGMFLWMMHWKEKTESQ